MHKIIKWYIVAFVSILVLSTPVFAQTTFNRDAILDEEVHTAATATAPGTELKLDANKHLVVFIDWAASTDAGGVTIEEIYETGDSTTWSAIGSEHTFLDDETDVVDLGRRYWRTVRVRISSTVTTGDVTVTVVGQ